MIGIDTNVIIDLFKNDRNLISLLEGIKETIALNQICYLELMFGLNPKNKKHNDEEIFYDNLFSSFPNLKLDNNSIKKSREILWELREIGKFIGGNDCMIAGIFLSNGVNKIITKNVKHFENIKELKVISY